MDATVDFVKGHCGWDVVTLVPEGQVAAADELAASLRIVSPPVDGGLEVGWMGRGERPDEIHLRMVSSTAKTWIPMCGGMTQVIGKALVETFLRDHFGIDATQPLLTITLITPSGPIPIEIRIRDSRVASVSTVMDAYVAHLYSDGIEPLCLEGVPLLRVGTYAVMDVRALEKRHPHVDFTRRDPGPHLDIVNQVLQAFSRHLGTSGVNGMLYDDRPEGGEGRHRVFPRFYSDDLAAARIPWEFQCGTGSVAVAIALAREGNAVFEWGSFRTTPDPYGIRTSQLTVQKTGERLSKVTFSHSVVEILAQGRMTLPKY